jgi:hypothetical protein
MLEEIRDKIRDWTIPFFFVELQLAKTVNSLEILAVR